MLNQIVSPRTNSGHFFPDNTPGVSFAGAPGEAVLVKWPVKGQRFVRSIDNFFNKKLLKKVNTDLERMDYIQNPLMGNRNIFKVPLIGDTTEFGFVSPKISFDENYHLENKTQLREHLDEKRAPESVIELFEDSIEQLATIGEWSNTTIPVHSFFLRYHLDSKTPNVKGLTWHSDLNSLSMTAVISHRKQDEGEFDGGNLFFAERTKDLCKFINRSESENTIVGDTIKEFSYPENGCLIFENLWSNHKVSDINKVAGNSCERVLFSIFANPDPDQLTSFLNKNKDKNLV